MNILNRLIPAMSFKWFVFDVQVLNRAYATISFLLDDKGKPIAALVKLFAFLPKNIY